jgi:uncharacterized protein involved in type VI secretion and phage assembly
MNGTECGPFYGKYRGMVVNNQDPQHIGRLQAQVPDVLGLTPSSWAMPCVPLAGPQMGAYLVPPPGAGVWIEFEQGNPDYPIWVGCWWGGAEELPALASAAPPPLQNVVLQTAGQHTVLLSDLPTGGGIVLKSPRGAAIAVSDQGIVLSDGQGAMITLKGGVVTVNQGALVVK